MQALLDTMLTGQYRILTWFFAAILFIYIPGMFIWLRRRKQRSAQYEMEHPDAVKVFIGRSMANDLLTVYAINGEDPVMHSKGIWYGFYLRPGMNVIEAQYQWTTVSLFAISGYETHHVDPVRLEVKARMGKEYELRYDHEREDYVFARLKKK